MHTHDYKFWGVVAAIAALAAVAGYVFLLLDDLRYRYRRARLWWGR
jgi:hypothetical protein